MTDNRPSEAAIHSAWAKAKKDSGLSTCTVSLDASAFTQPTTDRLAEVLRRTLASGPYQSDGTMARELVNPDGPEGADLLQSLSTDLDKAQRRIAELEKGIGSALTCTPTIGREYVGIAGMPYRNVVVYDCGNPWNILRAALNPSKEGV